jgi:hypothetical protein
MNNKNTYEDFSENLIHLTAWYMASIAGTTAFASFAFTAFSIASCTKRKCKQPQSIDTDEEFLSEWNDVSLDATLLKKLQHEVTTCCQLSRSILLEASICMMMPENVKDLKGSAISCTINLKTKATVVYSSLRNTVRGDTGSTRWILFDTRRAGKLSQNNIKAYESTTGNRSLEDGKTNLSSLTTEIEWQLTRKASDASSSTQRRNTA